MDVEASQATLEKEEEVMRRNDVLEAVIRELNAGGVVFWIENGAKHLIVRWIGRRPRAMTVSRTGSTEWHAATNSRLTVRRMLRQDGMTV